MKLSTLMGVAALAALSSCAKPAMDSATQAVNAQNVERAVQQLDTVAQEILERSGIPGMAIAVVHQGETVYAKGFGVRRLGEPEPIDRDTVFQLASVSKSVGATVVASQVGLGNISWDSRVVETLPWFALNDRDSTRNLTIGDLYAHRSGLPDHAGDELEEIGYTRREVLERLHHLPVLPLRAHYNYTNFGMTAGAEAVATAAGTEWESLSEAAIYRPLGMSRTSSRYSDYIGRSNRAHPHVRSQGVYVPSAQRQPDAQSPAGGVSSSVTDMANWMNLVLGMGNFKGTRLIALDALAPALRPQILSAPAEGERPAGHYGYGFNVSTSAAGHKMLNHSGAFLMGAATTFSLLPAAVTGIVVLTNAEPVGAAEAVSMTYMDLVQFGRPSRDWYALFEQAFAPMTAPEGSIVDAAFPTTPDPALAPHAYVGTYRNAYYGDLVIGDEGGQLMLTVGPAAKRYALAHWDGNTFALEPDGEIAPAGSRFKAEFGVGADGLMHSVKVELFDENGLGTFTR